MKMIKLNSPIVVVLTLLCLLIASNCIKTHKNMEERTEQIGAALFRTAFTRMAPMAVKTGGGLLTAISAYGAASDIVQGVKEGDIQKIGTNTVALGASFASPHQKFLVAADYAIKCKQFYQTPVSITAAGDMSDVIGGVTKWNNFKIAGGVIAASNVCINKHDEMRWIFQTAYQTTQVNADLSQLSPDKKNTLDKIVTLSPKRRLLTEGGSSSLPKLTEAQVKEILVGFKEAVKTIRPKLKNLDNLASKICPCIYWIYASIGQAKPIPFPKKDTCAKVPADVKKETEAIPKKLNCLQADGKTPNMTQQEYIDGLNYLSAAAKVFYLVDR